MQKKEIQEDQKISKWITWTYKYRQKILYFFMTVILLFVAIYRFAPFLKEDPMKKYSEIVASFKAWQKDWDDTSKKEEFLSILQKNPLEKHKYLPYLVQNDLFEKKDIDIDPVFKKIDSLQPICNPYASFSRTTLLLKEGRIDEALLQAKNLRKELQEDSLYKNVNEQAGSLLYAWNLMRIIFLEKEMKHNEEELAAWLELESLLQNQEDKTLLDNVSREMLIKNFRKDNNVELAEYMSHRKNQIFTNTIN